jgi:8-oxo-dGTP pyrophosphatase MutT (NUDIX family)
MDKTRKNGPWTVNSTKIVYKDPWFEMKVDSVISPAGKETTFGTMKFKDGTLVLPCDHNGNVYLVKQFRYALGKESVEVPAGHIENGQEPMEAAKRELSEEAGIKAKRWTPLGKAKISPNEIENTIYFFLAEDLTFGKTNPDETEMITNLKVSLDEALRMVESGEIIDEPSGHLILKAKMVLDRRSDGKIIS